MRGCAVACRKASTWATCEPELPDAMGDFDDLLFYPQPGAVKYVRSNRKRGNMNSRLHASIN